LAPPEIALESAIEKAEAEVVRRSSTWTANSDQGPPIQVPAANENDNFVAHASHPIGFDADTRIENRPAACTPSSSGRCRKGCAKLPQTRRFNQLWKWYEGWLPVWL
jgi:hypothetical protein